MLARMARSQVSGLAAKEQPMSTRRDDDLVRNRDLTRDPDTWQEGADDAGEPRQPVTHERQHMPDTGNVPVPPGEDIMDEARDGFMDRYPPRGQSSDT
jgi:hypothetical protein